MLHHHHSLDIVHQRQAEAERVAAVHRSTRESHEASVLRSGLARILIRAGDYLSPTPAPSRLPNPPVRLVTGGYRRTYRTYPNCC